MNVDAFAKLFFLGLVVFTAFIVVLAVDLYRHASNHERGNRLLIAGPIVLMITAVGILLLFGAVGFYSQPKSCISCHEMLTEYKTWRKSNHGHVKCLGCHLKENSAIGLLTEDARALTEVYAHLTGKYDRIINRESKVSEEMDSAVCERCHNQKRLGKVLFGNRVKMSHQPHIKLGIACPLCHNRITHKEARGFNYRDGLSMMGGCMRCHSPDKGREIRGKRASASCSICHSRDFAQQIFGTRSPTRSDFDQCSACHDKSDPDITKAYSGSKMSETVSCEDCHESHFKDLVADPDPKQCGDCHSEAAKNVVKHTHGRDFRHPFTRPSKVRCDFCHKPHRFAIPQKK